MKYAVIKIVNSNFSIDSEWDNNLQGALVQFHGVCKTLWNALDVETATVEIIDQQGDVVQGYKEFIYHDPLPPEPTPEPTPEPEPETEENPE